MVYLAMIVATYFALVIPAFLMACKSGGGESDD